MHKLINFFTEIKRNDLRDENGNFWAYKTLSSPSIEADNC